MADLKSKWHDNVPGKFYTDRSCIYCFLCASLAPNNFDSSEDDDHDVVYKQPSGEEELKQCYDALRNCPVNAIGDDGDS